MKKAVLNTLVQIVGKGITIFISLLTTGMLTRGLGSMAYGQYILISSSFVFLDSLADFGIKIMGVKLASEDKKKREEIWIQGAWAKLLMTGVAFLLGLILIYFWEGFFPIRLEATVALLMMWFTSVAGSLEIVWQTRMRMEKKVIIEVIYPSIFLLALWQYTGKITLMWVFVSYLLARIISLCLALLWERRLVAKFSRFDKEKVKMILKNSWPMGLYLLIFTGYDRAVDSLMLERFLGAKEVAFYGLSYKIYSSLLQPVYFFVASVFPMLSDKETNKKRVFGWSALLIALGLIFMMGFTYTLAPWMVGVLGGAEFEASISILRILVLAMIFAFYNHLIGFTLISKGGQRTMLGLGLIVLLFNVTMNLLAIPRFGVSGAAYVTVATEAISLILMSTALLRKRK